MKKAICTLLISLITATCFPQKIPARFDPKKLHWCKPNGISDSVLCGLCPVAENRQTNKSRIIHLNVVVIPAVHSDSLLAPIFDIDGGPGAADTKSVWFYADPENPYHQHHDIVLVDVRGTGQSNPLNCYSLQYKASLDEQFDDMYPPEKVKQCYDELSKIADLKQYTTTNIVKDLEDVRKWLGYDEIELFSLSYGTRVALVYMKLFPASLRACVLWSPIPTYGKMPMYHAVTAQKTLERLFAACKNDPDCNATFPDLEKEFYTLMNAWFGRSMIVKHIDSLNIVHEIEISWDGFETGLRQLMYSPAGLRQIPYIIHQCYINNFEPVLSYYPQGSDTSKFIAEGLYLCVTCAEDVPFIKTAKKKGLDSLTQHTFMGSYRIDQQKAACKNWAHGEIPAGFLDTIHSEIPTLIFSGSYDPVTPSWMASEIASHLPHSTLVTIPEMSHIFDGLNNIDCFDHIAVDFLNNPFRNVNYECVKTMTPPPFKLK